MTTSSRVQASIVTALLGVLFPTVAWAQHMPSAPIIFKNSKPSVVLIIAGNSKGEPTVQGSGFIIAQGQVVTNHHVVAGTSTAMVVFSDGATAKVKSVIADSAAKDLIVLGVNTGDRQSLHLGDEMSLKQGDPVYAIGAPEGLELTLTNGIVSAFRNIGDRFEIQTTAAIGHGSSGGPLLDENGNVVGITSALLSGTPGIYFSVGVGDLKRMLRTPSPMLLPFADWSSENSTTATENSAGAPSNSTTSDVNSIESLLQNEKFDQAGTAIAAFAQEHPDTDVVQRLNGELHERRGDTDDALKELAGYVKAEPNDATGQFFYALALYQARDFTDALQHEQKSDALAPTAADQPVLAVLYYSLRDYPDAEKAATNTLTSDPKNTFALEVLAGVAYHGASDTKTTWQEYVTSLSTLDPGNFWVHLSRALDAYNQKQVETAVAEFKAAEETQFPDSTPFYLLSNWFSRSSQLGEANDQITAGLVSVPDDPLLLNEGIYVSLRAHENTEAARRFDSLAHDYPDALVTQAAGCLYYYGIGQPQEALPYCARQVTLAPTDHTAYSNYGWAALDANQFDLASQQFSQAYKIAYPNWNQMDKTQVVDLMWGFALAEYNSGDKKRAHKLVKVLRETYPDAATVTGLQQLPLLWSETTMNRIEAVLMEWPK